ncbi:MAG: hypothetical protein RL169_616, partial [Armatimonadota bacterium]
SKTALNAGELPDKSRNLDYVPDRNVECDVVGL